MPPTWEMTLGEEARPLWDRLQQEGKVTPAKAIATGRELGEDRHGGAHAATAWLLLGLEDDPIPLLREMIKDQNLEHCAFAAGTAGALGDTRLEPDLDALMADKRLLSEKTVENSGRVTLGEVVEDALDRMMRGGVLTGDREEGFEIQIPSWLKLAPPASPEIDEAIRRSNEAYLHALNAAGKTWRKSFAAALSSATEVEILLLDGKTEKVDAGYIHWENRQARDRFPIMPYGGVSKILARRHLTQDEVKRLMPSLQATLTAEDQQPGAFCHSPVHGLRIYNGVENGKKIIFQTSICYQCSNFYIAIDGEADWAGLTSKEFQAVMEGLMPIPEELRAIDPR